MASAWGTSWGTSWGNSWGDVGAPAVVADVQRGGTSSKRKKKRGKVIRYSDFESRDAYEKALAAALPVYVPAVPEILEEDEDDADDEALLHAITVTLLH